MDDADSNTAGPAPSASTMWRVVSLGSGALAGVAARRAVQALWPGERSVPPNPADRSVTWSEALAWAVGLGVAGAVTRTITQRAAASAWQAATGESPPGVAMHTGGS